jgi:transposase
MVAERPVARVLPVSRVVTRLRRVAVMRKPAAFTISGLTTGIRDQKAAGIVFQDTASVLFGVEGLQVTCAEEGADGTVEIWAVTDYPAAAACPGCATVSDRVHETVVTRPRDVRRAGDPVDLRWVKVRRKCGNPACPRKTFTEWVPALPPRCRITARLREQAAGQVAGRGITPAEAARHAGISWPTAHEAFAAAADGVLDQSALPVAHLGIDEHRRGRARFAVDEQTGEYILLADRWHTCFFDLSGRQGLLGQVQGRTADDAAYWLAQAPPAWRDRIEAVCTDLCSIYVSAVRRMLPHATLTADLFHVVQLAVKAVGDVRRRVVRARYGRRGRSGDPEYGIKNPCWYGTWSTCHPPSSPRSSTPWTATCAGRRSPPPGSPRRNCVTRLTCGSG